MSWEGGDRRKRYARAFGAVLRDYRKRAGITQDELAARAGFDRTFPSLLERGLRTPTLTVFCVLAEALSVSPADLMSATAAERAGTPQEKLGKH